MADLNWSEIQAFVKEQYIPVLSDQVFESSPLLAEFKKRQVIKGGKDLVISPILYAKNTAHGSVKGFSEVNINPNKKWTAVAYDWRTRYVSIALSFDETDPTEGDPNAIMSLIENEMKVAKMTMADDLTQDIFNDGSDDQVPHGLQHIVNVDRTLGDIDSTTYTWWDANKFDDTTNYTKANMTDPTSAYYVTKLLRKAWNAAKHNSEEPQTIVITPGWENILEEEFFPMTRYANSEKKANVDHSAYQYKGKADFLVDTECPDGFAFFLNWNWISMYVHKARNFDVGPFQKPVNALGRVCQITLKCNFASNGPRMLARIRTNADVDA